MLLPLTIKPLLALFIRPLSFTGIALGILFACWSLTPSLVPRTYLMQGILTGFSVYIGYSLGFILQWLCLFLQIPSPTAKNRRILGLTVSSILLIIFAVTLFRVSIWQNDIRNLMQMPNIDSAYIMRIVISASIIAALLLMISRAIHILMLLVKKLIDPWLPRRVAIVVSMLSIVLLLTTFVDGFILKRAINIADQTFDVIDREVANGINQPKGNDVSGSTHSLIQWEDIGKRGKEFITQGPSLDTIKQLTNKPSIKPIRIYSGFRTGSNVEERSQITFEEMRRLHAFERSILIIATPTGTGWMDEAAMDSVEILHAGDTAIVAMQYSYLPSWITLLVDPERSKRSSQHLFDKVYQHWKTLPAATRPKLYVQGLSLGSLGAEQTVDAINLLSDPIDGAVFSGPPFPSTRWSRMIDTRDPSSTSWQPVYKNGDVVRFSIDGNNLLNPDNSWDSMRIAYLQHASDPMSFFSTDLFFNKPDWLQEKRGPDVSSYVKWYPIITGLQVAFDTFAATDVPIGYGHSFAPWEYIGAWQAVTQPEDWNQQDIDQLKNYYRGQYMDK